MEALHCNSCSKKFIRCSFCKNQELKFNKQWEMVCNNVQCINHGQSGPVTQNPDDHEAHTCKTCNQHYKCQVNDCSLIAKRKCKKCPRYIGLCQTHNVTSTDRHNVDMCENCDCKYCSKCETVQNYNTSPCNTCGLRQCNNCFDFKTEIHNGKIMSYTCLMCQSESERTIYPHNILLTVDLDECYESCPCQYPCTIKLRSGTVVLALVQSDVIKEMMLKGRERGNLSEAIERNWSEIYERCEDDDYCEED